MYEVRGMSMRATTNMNDLFAGIIGNKWMEKCFMLIGFYTRSHWKKRFQNIVNYSSFYAYSAQYAQIRNDMSQMKGTTEKMIEDKQMIIRNSSSAFLNMVTFRNYFRWQSCSSQIRNALFSPQSIGLKLTSQVHISHSRTKEKGTDFSTRIHPSYFVYQSKSCHAKVNNSNPICFFTGELLFIINLEFIYSTKQLASSVWVKTLIVSFL